MEELKGRSLLSAVAPAIVMDSATTNDSRSVTVQYDIKNTALAAPLTLGIYRSADSRFDPSDTAIGSAVVTLAPEGAPILDDAGVPALAEGHHQLTVPLPQGLPLDPQQPYVLVVADPSKVLKGVTESPDTAWFRTYSIGVITHGGLQPRSWRLGVPWELRMASSLAAEDYNAVIPYNWVSESGHAGAAAKQGPRLGRMVLAAAAQFPAGAPVDVHFIGHSEGTVVNSLALQYIGKHETPELRAGFVQDTLLDPHAANNHVPGGKQFSAESGLLGEIARIAIQDYQRRAHDPLPVVPANVNEAEVFYQHNPVAVAKGSNHGIYNLWGQVPVPVQGIVPVHYYNLSGSGISHGGDFSVPNWYQAHVVPTLGTGAPFSDPTRLSGGLAGGSGATSNQPTFQGTAEPGATVVLHAEPRGTSDVWTLGRTVADVSGTWSVTARPLPNGTYHVTAHAVAAADPAWPHVFVTPNATLGEVTIGTPGARG